MHHMVAIATMMAPWLWCLSCIVAAELCLLPLLAVATFDACLHHYGRQRRRAVVPCCGG